MHFALNIPIPIIIQKQTFTFLYTFSNKIL